MEGLWVLSVLFSGFPLSITSLQTKGNETHLRSYKSVGTNPTVSPHHTLSCFKTIKIFWVYQGKARHGAVPSGRPSQIGNKYSSFTQILRVPAVRLTSSEWYSETGVQVHTLYQRRVLSWEICRWAMEWNKEGGGKSRNEVLGRLELGPGRGGGRDPRV